MRRRRWIVRRKLEGWSNRTIALHLGVCSRTVMRWWHVYRSRGWDGLVVKSRRPHVIHATPQAVVDRVLEIRSVYNYGPNKIEAELRRQGISLGHNTIHRLLVRHGLNNPLENPRKTWGNTRFEREHSNSLWQADFKLTLDDRWMITYLDDHSRFVTGCKINEDATGENAIKLLERAIDRYDKPMQVLTDQGPQFVNPRGGITEFQEFLAEHGIEHITASKRRPTTIIKVERWHKTYEEERPRFKQLHAFVYYYNFKRPHQALGYQTPAEVYAKDRVTDVLG